MSLLFFYFCISFLSLIIRAQNDRSVLHSLAISHTWIIYFSTHIALYMPCQTTKAIYMICKYKLHLHNMLQIKDNNEKSSKYLLAYQANKILSQELSRWKVICFYLRFAFNLVKLIQKAIQKLISVYTRLISVWFLTFRNKLKTKESLILS